MFKPGLADLEKLGEKSNGAFLETDCNQSPQILLDMSLVASRSDIMICVL